MSLAEHRKPWSEHFDSPPELCPTDLMRLVLSWRHHARVCGLYAGMPRKPRRKTVADHVSSIDLEIGSALRREWQGNTYEVEVEYDGFNWADKTQASARRTPATAGTAR